MRITIKPLSVNACYNGRRFKNETYKAYETELFLRLPPFKIPEGKLKLNIKFGFSSKGSDIDNCVKPFQDILQKVYEFNDNVIYELYIQKIDVKKGEEFIDFDIKNYV